MQLTVEAFTVHKKFALQISRGTTAESTNILLRIQQENIEGWGEASPFSTDKNQIKGANDLLSEFRSIVPPLEKFHPLQRQEILETLQQLNVSSSIQAAVDMALYDWLGKKSRFTSMADFGLELRSHCTDFRHHWHQYSRSSDHQAERLARYVKF